MSHGVKTSNTSRAISRRFDILKILAAYHNAENTAKIIFNWCYEHGDGEVLELGEFMESKLKVKFNYKEIR